MKRETREARAKNIANIINSNNECGKYGMLFEMECKTAVAVAGKGETDKLMFVINENGKKSRKTVECKTNGGRVDNILDSDYIIYKMDICNSTTKGKRRVTEPIIMKTETFMNILKECGAIKKVNKGGMLDGHAIQVSNKAFYETMLNYPIKYENGRTYKASEIR